jgi:FkbM family methyltransferase
MLHRFWRYRLRTERTSIQFVLDSDFAGQTLADVGANKGMYAYWMSRAAGPDGRVVSFEAQPELGAYLEDVKRVFNLDNVTVVNEGLSSRPGELCMRRPGVGSGAASFHLDAEGGLEELRVPVTTLDAWFANSKLRPVTFVKCDVQDHELEVFRGGEELLREDRPTLLFEVCEHEAQTGEIFEYLAGLGYDGFFYHVSREDHASMLRRNRGSFVHYSQHADYPYLASFMKHRNYIFVDSANTARFR